MIFAQLVNAHKLANYTQLTGRHTAGEEAFSEARTAVIDEDDILSIAGAQAAWAAALHPPHRPVTVESDRCSPGRPVCKQGCLPQEGPSREEVLPGTAALEVIPASREWC